MIAGHAAVAALFTTCLVMTIGRTASAATGTAAKAAAVTAATTTTPSPSSTSPPSAHNIKTKSLIPQPSTLDKNLPSPLLMTSSGTIEDHSFSSSRINKTSNDRDLCFPSPFIDCGDHPTTTFITSSTSFGLGLARKRPRVSLTPWRISFVNMPRWLEREIKGANSCSRPWCEFSGGGVTSLTDVVVVHAKRLKDSDMPATRTSGQIYVLMSWEPPLLYESKLTKGSQVWNSAFNLTMTYRLDSDIFWPTYTLNYAPKPSPTRPSYENFLATKTKTAVWFVSNCHTQSQRELYVREMQSYIDVDIYGACGTPAPCRYDMDNQPCLFKILQEYKFYLAFENSFCQDYVTEKVFKIYSRDTHIVPVVRGSLDYDRYLPPNTFVNAASFSSARDLALHLKRLGSDPQVYGKYLQQKDLYELKVLENRFCRLCQALLDTMTLPGVYDMSSWVWEGCHAPTDLSTKWAFLMWALLVLGVLVYVMMLICQLHCVLCSCRCVILTCIFFTTRVGHAFCDVSRRTWWVRSAHRS